MIRQFNKQFTFCLLRTSLAILLSCTVYCQCTENVQKKIFLIGDSWASYMWYDGTISTVANDWGHSDVDYHTHAMLNELGAETDDFLKPEKIAQLTQDLLDRPELKVIHLSVAGNDFLGSWKTSFSQQQVDSLYEGMIGRLDSIIDTIHALRPDIHIVWSGYTYTNFQESIEQVPNSFRSSHPFYSNWQNMEFPTPTQINNLQNWFQQQVQERYQADPKFTYIPASSILQYTFGQANNLTIPPGGSYPPQTVDIPLGMIDYPSPLTSMRHYGTIPFVNIPIKDCFHLSSQGYYDFISYQFQKFYHKFLMEDDYALADNVLSGGVSQSGNISHVQVGKNSTDNYVSILQFDNTHWKSFVPEKVSLFLRIDSMSGENFLSSGDFEIDVIHGFFGDVATLDGADYASSSTATTSACVFGNPTQGKWVRLDFPETFASQLRNQAMQLRIRHTGSTEGIIAFTNDTQADFQAVLNVKYSTTPYPDDEEEKPDPPDDEDDDEDDNTVPPTQTPEENLHASDHSMDNAMTIFPNPINDQYIHISTSQAIVAVSIYTLSGQLQMHSHDSGSSIHVASLTAGMYLLEVETQGTVQQFKLIKN